MELLIYLSIALVIILFLYIFFKKPKNIKSKEEKQQEIIDNYTQKLQHIKPIQAHNKELYMQEKTKLLISINKELEFNIFFTKKEKDKLIRELSTL